MSVPNEETLKYIGSFITHTLEAKSVVMSEKKWVIGNNDIENTIYGPFTQQEAIKFKKDMEHHCIDNPSPYFWHEYTIKSLVHPYH
jgi:hypothetical protein